MPLHLVHGFKWPRQSIIMHVLKNGLEAASPDWIMSAATSEALTTSFRKHWPRPMAKLPNLLFFEQHDPMATARLERKSDFAFVADQVKEVDGLSIDAGTLTRMVAAPEEVGALEALRDILSKGTEIEWWIVYNGDTERDDLGDGDDEEEEDETKEGGQAPLCAERDESKAGTT